MHEIIKNKIKKIKKEWAEEPTSMHYKNTLFKNIRMEVRLTLKLCAIVWKRSLKENIQSD